MIKKNHKTIQHKIIKYPEILLCKWLVGRYILACMLPLGQPKDQQVQSPANWGGNVKSTKEYIYIYLSSKIYYHLLLNLVYA